MNLDAMIGKRVQLARKGAGLSQAQLGARLERYMGRGLKAQSISEGEAGRRTWAASEVFAIAAITQRPLVSFFLMGPDEELDLGDGNTLNHLEVRALSGAEALGPEYWLRAEEVAGRIVDLAATINQANGSLIAAARRLSQIAQEAEEEAGLDARPDEEEGP